MTDLKNPLTRAYIVAKQVDPVVYHNTGKEFERGDPRFIMSAGNLHAILDCPAKWRAGGDVGDKTRSLDFGSLFDCRWQTPELLEKRYAITPKTYPAEGRRKDDPPTDRPWTRQATFCKEWEAEREKEGKMVIKHDLADEVTLALSVAETHELAVRLRDGSDHQVMVMGEYVDEATQITVPIKSLIDMVPRHDSLWPKCLFDLKTAACGAPRAFSRAAWDNSYDLQAALYLDIYTAATQEDRNTFAFLVIENSHPYHLTEPWPALSAERLELGRLNYQAALKAYCQSLATGIWPSYPVPGGTLVTPDGLQFLNAEAWMLS